MDEGTVKGEPADHAFVDGKCTVCEYECQHDQQTAGTAQQGELLRYEATAEQHTPVYETQNALHLRRMRRDGKDGRGHRKRASRQTTRSQTASARFASMSASTTRRPRARRSRAKLPPL